MSEFGFGHVLLVAAILYIVVRPLVQGYRKGRWENDAESATTHGESAVRDAVTSYHWPAIGDYEFEVVGESHYQEALSRLAGTHGEESADKECVAYLMPEDTNPYDSKAVAVRILGKTVGYLTRDDARSFRRRLAQKNLAGLVTTCNALIVGGGVRQGGERLFYGVRLDLKPFE